MLWRASRTLTLPCAAKRAGVPAEMALAASSTVHTFSSIGSCIACTLRLCCIAAVATRCHLSSLPAVWTSPASDGDFLLRELPIESELCVRIGVNAKACSSVAFSISQSDLPPLRLPLATTKSNLGPCHSIFRTGPHATTCTQFITAATSCHIPTTLIQTHQAYREYKHTKNIGATLGLLYCDDKASTSCADGYQSSTSKSFTTSTFRAHHADRSTVLRRPWLIQATAVVRVYRFQSRGPHRSSGWLPRRPLNCS